MHTAYYKFYSQCLNREMEFKVYGHAGLPLLEFPTQDGHFNQFEDYHMPDCIYDYLQEGKVQVFCCDSIDEQTWSDLNGDQSHRAWLDEQWYYYITTELVPQIQQIRKEMAPADGRKLITTGFSMGATHAMNFFLRRPDLFGGVIALSGVYHASYFFPNYQDKLVYNNSPLDYLPNMPVDHPYVSMYNDSDIIFCCGQGAWEDVMIADSFALNQQFIRLGVNAWFDLWGKDVNHDWPWWRKQLPYFLSKIIGE